MGASADCTDNIAAADHSSVTDPLVLELCASVGPQAWVDPMLEKIAASLVLTAGAQATWCSPPPLVASQEMEALLVDTRSSVTTTTHDTREVSEDPLLEEVAASFVAISACTCATSTMVSHPAHLAMDMVLPPLEHGQSQVTPT